MVHGIPLHTAGLYFSSKSTEAANLVISGFEIGERTPLSLGPRCLPPQKCFSGPLTRRSR